MPSEIFTANSLFALVDCNNFYVSCERLFNPKLKEKPVVVLSGTDGIILARSNEAKELGIPMGVPYFEWRDCLEKHQGVALVSNFALYGDLSRRVMETLSHFHPDLEIYSIDEAFLLLPCMQDPLAYAYDLRSKVMQWTGIPVSIGIASTKTLAKLANKRAKKDSQNQGVFALCEPHEIDSSLENLPLKEIWGIGSRMESFLRRKGIRTALELKNQNDLWLKAHLSSPFIKTVLELRGISSYSTEDIPQPKKSIVTSRSFRHAITEKEELFSAIAHFASRAGEKLREEKSLASLMTLFIATSRHQEDYSCREAVEIFPEPTHFTPRLLEAAQKAFNTIYRRGLAYKRAGILLSGLVSETQTPLDLFSSSDKKRSDKERKLSSLCDQINDRYGTHMLHFGSEGNWSDQQQHHHTPAYTTDFSDFLKVKI